VAVNVTVGERVSVAVGGLVGTWVGVDEGSGVLDGGMRERATVRLGVCAGRLHPASKNNAKKIDAKKYIWLFTFISPLF